MPCGRSRYPDGVSGSTPERASGTRSVALVLVVFAATLLLLFGALNLTRRTDPAAAAASPTPSAQATEAAEATATQSESLAPTTPSPSTASPSASADTDAVLTGAGDIASCSSGADKKTAA